MDEQEIFKKDEERIKSLYNRDAVRYYLLCNELGIEPEAFDLYELGRIPSINKTSFLEKEVKGNEKSLRKNKNIKVSNTKYKEFYEDSKDVSLNPGVDVSIKRELLSKYFPKRFGEEGRNSVYNLDSFQVNRVFRNLIDYSEKRLKI